MVRHRRDLRLGKKNFVSHFCGAKARDEKYKLNLFQRDGKRFHYFFCADIDIVDSFVSVQMCSNGY